MDEDLSMEDLMSMLKKMIELSSKVFQWRITIAMVVFVLLIGDDEREKSSLILGGAVTWKTRMVILIDGRKEKSTEALTRWDFSFAFRYGLEPPPKK
ncbi:hypothetical protein Tco_1302902 [Tanacetum coccineum]